MGRTTTCEDAYVQLENACNSMLPQICKNFVAQQLRATHFQLRGLQEFWSKFKCSRKGRCRRREGRGSLNEHNSPSYSEQEHLALGHGPHHGPIGRPHSARRHHAVIAQQPERHHPRAQRPDADADVGVHDHPEPLPPPPVPVAHARRDGVVEHDAPGGGHERDGGDAARRVGKAPHGGPPERDVAVGVGQRDAALAVAVPELDPLVGVPRHDAGADGGVHGGGVADEAEAHGGQRLQVERRRARSVVEVGQAGGGQRQAEREQREACGQAARAAARAPAAAAVRVRLLLAVRLWLPGAARVLLLLLAVLVRRRRLEREHLRRRERGLLEGRRGRPAAGGRRRRCRPCRRRRLRPRLGRQGRLGRQRRLLGHGARTVLGLGARVVIVVPMCRCRAQRGGSEVMVWCLVAD
jgi:hypothetical protein